MSTAVLAAPPPPPPPPVRMALTHLSDYAVACNRIVCGARYPRERVFQLGGRRRLLFAAALTLERFDALAKQDLDPQEGRVEICEILSDLAVAVADGVFRERGPESTLRLLVFLIHRSEFAPGRADELFADQGKDLSSALEKRDRSEVEQILLEALGLPARPRKPR
ncbi:MAG: hypothetical protein AB7G28_14295 [Pirellulales bacterium]